MKTNTKSSSAQPISLQTLTAAALTLPGLLQNTALAYEEEASFSYGHYQEGKRELFGSKSDFNPIEVESLQGSAKFKLSDRIKFAFNYQQDTWGGATPIATSPVFAGGNIQRNVNGVLSGATPRINPGIPVYMDQQGNFFEGVNDPTTSQTIYKKNNQLAHTLSSASPEVRKQGDFKLSYDWDEAALDIGGGISVEDDYESRFGNINTRWDFNQKQTVFNVGVSYTNSDTNAIIDHDADPYISDKDRVQQYKVIGNHVEEANKDHDHDHGDHDHGGVKKSVIQGTRQDWSANMGLTQILNKNALLEVGLGFTRSTGYMANPYKVVTTLFFDPLSQNETNCPGFAFGLQCTDTARALLEQRPEERNQWNGSLRFVQHIEALDAALHFGYRIFSDDWGITSHTFDADWVQPLGEGWSVTPRIRYYSQDQADFYTPVLITKQGFTSNVVDPVKGQIYIDANNTDQEYYVDQTGTIIPDYNEIGADPNTGNALLDINGNPVRQEVVDQLSLVNKTNKFDRNKLPRYFSSDHRLSGFGALSGGVTVTKQFAKGVALDLGFEYYTHQGSLKIGGGGENNFADFDYWTANAALRVDLEAMSLAMAGGDHGEHSHTHHHHGAHAPAGVLFDHMLPKAGDWMVGYRYQWSSQNGALRNGTRRVNDSEFMAKACPDGTCILSPDSMNMSMHMLDLMYAPTDWLTLMLMPQWADMDMRMRKLDGAPSAPGNLSSHADHHAANGHESGGFGDLGMYALFKLFDDGTHHLHVTPGFTAPIADVDLRLRRNHQIDGGFLHYCMMLGSGTWDFTPSLTYTGHTGDWSWGAQANGVLRMGSRNKSGYKLGDIFQTTAWGGYNITPWLTATLRGVYTTQGSIRGQFFGSEGGQFVTGLDKAGNPVYSSILKFGSMDYPGNYGGRFGDVGFGLSAVVPTGAFAGNRFSVEWLQPVYNNMNGFQQNRDGTLSATWSLMF